MALVQTILTLLLRRAGKLLNTLFGWATTLLFGKVPEKRQLYLSVIALGSVLWLVVVVGIAFPSVATFLLAFVTIPEWVEPHWIRLAMLAAAVVLPLIVGIGSRFLIEPQQRAPGFKGFAKQALLGYPYTIGLAVTLLMMLVIAPIMKIQDVVRRWKSKHVPVVVEPEDYKAVVKDVQRTLWAGGLQTRQTRANALLRLPTKVFTWFVKGGIEDLVADELTSLKGDNLEVTIHPSDLLLRGRKEPVLRAFAVVLESMTFTPCYMTWTKEAREIEDRYEDFLNRIKGQEQVTVSALDELREIGGEIKQVNVSDEEMEVLLRTKSQAERFVLRRLAGLDDYDREQTLAEMESASALNSDDSKPKPKKQKPKRTSPVLVNTAAAVLAAITWARRGRKQSV